MKTFQTFLAAVLATLSGCANPSVAAKSEAADFQKSFPQHLKSIEKDGRRIHYAWNGDTRHRALVFVHGSPGSWEGWAHFLLDPALREKYHIIVVDRPGFGGSDAGATERSLQKQADAIMEVLRENKSGLPAILVGHSYGGAVIAKTAMSYPKQVAGTLFVASSVDPNLEKTKWYQYPADWWPIRAIIPSALKVCNQEIFALKAELVEMMPSWKNFSAKVATIQGEDDDLVPPGNQDFLLKMLEPKLIVQTVKVPGLNHFIPWKRPDLILNGIAALTKSLKLENP